MGALRISSSEIILVKHEAFIDETLESLKEQNEGTGPKGPVPLSLECRDDYDNLMGLVYGPAHPTVAVTSTLFLGGGPTVTVFLSHGNHTGAGTLGAIYVAAKGKDRDGRGEGDDQHQYKDK